MSDQPYDPYIPSGGAGGSQGQTGGSGNQRTAAIQAFFRVRDEPSGPGSLLGSVERLLWGRQIDDTVGIMRENINKVADRGARLDSLQDKTDNLAVSALGFRRGANRVRKQMWWKDMKMRMCIVVGIIILLVIVIVPVVIRHGGEGSLALRWSRGPGLGWWESSFMSNDNPTMNGHGNHDERHSNETKQK
ncbi:unnamed protein product [Tuber aestivum]|uniref:V-SNARE coiled-coil homology domain-containing protein n=1 Tax=Tuber aestivum TaxID=59557 RepID=A0A292Q560_9PEZI|nr:unnamed protein product [Tuber aestivum]